MTQDHSDKKPSGGSSVRHPPFKFDDFCSEDSLRRAQAAIRTQLHRTLRAATRSDQMMIDRIILRLDLARREDYGFFLNVHFAALRSLSMSWRDQDREDFSNMANCLQADLRSLSILPLPLQPAAHAGISTGTQLGIAYIVRGSRYDAMALRHRVPMQHGATYLEFSPALSWSRFLEQLERYVSEKSQRDDTFQIVSGAKLALAKFNSLLMGSLA